MFATQVLRALRQECEFEANLGHIMSFRPLWVRGLVRPEVLSALIKWLQGAGTLPKRTMGNEC